MSENIDLTELFPDMEPVSSAPTVFNVNGCGLMLYGRRDFDPNTGTYLATQCLTLIFFPLLCLKTFRVADAENGGWAIIGREPMSLLAKAWSMMVMGLIATGIGFGYWSSYTSSPEYIAGKNMEAALLAEEAGDWQGAAEKYQTVAVGQTTHKAKALEGFTRTVDTNISAISVEDAESLLRRSVNLANVADQEFSSRVIHDFAGKAVETHRATSPDKCRGLLKLVEPLVVKAREPGESREWLTKVTRELLEAAVAFPNPSIDLVVDLALALEQEGDLERCETILLERKTDLGTTEGARILGQIYSRRSDIDSAYELLIPYMTVRLGRLKEVNDSLAKTYESVQTSAINALQQGQAPESFYSRYDAANEETQNHMVSQFLSERLTNSPQIKDLREQIVELSGAIPAAIDLGILQLQRARQESDASRRKEELEQAEKTFLAVRGQLGETDSYRLFLGQVYFWMERQDEGRALFDKLLAENDSDQIQLQIAGVYREVGSVTESRKLCENVWEFSRDDKMRYASASMRSAMFTDVADQILWLGRCDPKSEQVGIHLNWAKAQKAIEDGKDDAAIRLCRQVVDAYATQPESAASLNNEALAWFSLANLAEEPASFDRGLEKIEKAIDLQPENSILLRNSTSVILQAAVRDLVGSQIDLRALRVDESMELLSYLYVDDDGYKQLAERVKQHPGIRKAVENYEKLTVLSPRSTVGWTELNGIYQYFDDDNKTKSMARRLQNAHLDQSDNSKRYTDFKSGTMDEIYKTRNQIILEESRAVISGLSGEPNLTYAVAVGEQVTANNGLVRIGENVDTDSDAVLALSAFQAVPCVALTRHVTNSHLTAMMETMKTKSSACKTLYDHHGRLVATEVILLLASRQDQTLANQIRQHPRYEGYIKAVRRNAENFAEHATIVRAELMRTLSETDIADEFTKRLLTDDTKVFTHQINSALYPFAPSSLLESYWYHSLVKKTDEAAAALSMLQKIEPELAALASGK